MPNETECWFPHKFMSRQMGEDLNRAKQEAEQARGVPAATPQDSSRQYLFQVTLFHPNMTADCQQSACSVET